MPAASPGCSMGWLRTSTAGRSLQIHMAISSSAGGPSLQSTLCQGGEETQRGCTSPKPLRAANQTMCSGWALTRRHPWLCPLPAGHGGSTNGWEQTGDGEETQSSIPAAFPALPRIALLFCSPLSASSTELPLALFLRPR